MPLERLSSGKSPHIASATRVILLTDSQDPRKHLFEGVWRYGIHLDGHWCPLPRSCKLLLLSLPFTVYGSVSKEGH